MGRFTRRGITRVLWLPTIADPSGIPSRSEIDAAVNLNGAINAVDGWTLENQPIATPDMASTFDASMPGNDQAADSSLTLYEDDLTDDMEALLAKGTVGYVVFLRKGDVPGSRSMDVFAVRVGSQSPTYSVDNDPALFTVKFTITSAPIQGATVPDAGGTDPGGDDMPISTDPTDIQPLGTRAAGSTGKAADAGHVHPMPRLDQAGAPTGPVSLAGQLLTNLADGTASGHAATVNQLPAAATTSTPGLLQLAGDLAGTSTSPQVTALHLAAALPLTQGGTGATTAAGARSGLGLGAAATMSVGTTSGTVAAGDDSRLSNARTPTSHASTHATAGADPVAPSSIGALAASSNLADIASAATSRSNLGLGTAATANIDTTTTDYQPHGTPTAGATGKAADAGHIHPSPFWVPADNGLLAAVYDPAHAGTVTSQASATVAGHITLTKIMLRQQITWSSIWFGLSGVDAGAALTNCYLGVYDASGNLKGVSADISSALSTSAVAKAATLTTPFTATPGAYFIAMLLNGTWTTNSFTFKAAGSGISVNANLTAPNLRYSNMLTGQTSLPSTLTLTGQTTTIIGGGWGSQWYGVA